MLSLEGGRGAIAGGLSMPWEHFDSVVVQLQAMPLLLRFFMLLLACTPNLAAAAGAIARWRCLRAGTRPPWWWLRQCLRWCLRWCM